MTFVLDTSVAICWLLKDGNEHGIRYATKVLDLLQSESAVVPNIWPLEVSNVLLKAVAKKLVAQERADEFIVLLRDLDITIDEETAHHALQATRILAQRRTLSSYDAAYLELAKRRGLPLATLDQALFKAAHKEKIDAPV